MSNFKCSECGMINIDCGKEGFKTPRELELEARVKELEQKLNAQFTEMEEKLTAEEMKNYELKEKLRIALSSLNDIATIDNYIVAQVDAQQALQKISEVEDES